MSSITRLAGPWLRRLRRARLSSANTLVGAQWIGAELVLARLRVDGERPEIDHVSVLPAPLESRVELIKRLADSDLLDGASVALEIGRAHV